MRIAITILLVTQIAFAAPLPKGLRVFSKDERLYVSRDGMTLPMVDPEVEARNTFGAVKSAELSADGKTIHLAVDICAGDTFDVPLAAVEARFANARGMQAHLKQRYPEAIAQFAVAAAADRDEPVYATNLLSAQSMGRQLDDADHTLTVFGPAHPAWFAWRLAVDPDLANVLGRPSAKALIAAKPSKLTYRALDEAVAISPLGFAAVREWSSMGDMSPNGEQLAIYDLRSGQEALRLPVVADEDACVDRSAPEGIPMPVCTAKMRAHTAAHTREADRVLAILGFEKRATSWVDGNDADRYVSSDKRTTVDLGAGEVSRGSLKLAYKSEEGSPMRVAFAGDVVLLQFRQGMIAHCTGDARRSYSRAIWVH